MCWRLPINKAFTPFQLNYRRIISFLLLWFLLIMALSGLMVFIAPSGRLAGWIAWSMWGLDKSAWKLQHTVFSYLFLIFGLIHLFYFNRKALFTSVKKGMKRSMEYRTEGVLALLLTFTLFTVNLKELPPSNLVIDMGNWFGEIWISEKTIPPMPYTERFTVEQLASKVFEIHTDSMLQLFENCKVPVENKNKTLNDLATENNLTPMELFYLLKNEMMLAKP